LAGECDDWSNQLKNNDESAVNSTKSLFIQNVISKEKAIQVIQCVDLNKLIPNE
jgi:hypothetical protein